MVTHHRKSLTKRLTTPGETDPCNCYVLETAVEMLTALGSALVNIPSWLRPPPEYDLCVCKVNPAVFRDIKNVCAQRP